MSEAVTPLQARRIALGFTLRDVEQIMFGAISNAYLSQLETGKIKNPSLATALALGAAYATPVEQIAEWLGKAPSFPAIRTCPECGQAIPIATRPPHGGKA